MTLWTCYGALQIVVLLLLLLLFFLMANKHLLLLLLLIYRIVHGFSALYYSAVLHYVTPVLVGI